jgi:DNA-directed RNA polymerase specialized sigma24 family protein
MESQSTVPVAELARRCAEEMMYYQRRDDYDPTYCYELFRCALVDRDEEAWTALYTQYYRLVCRWLGNASGDVDALANEAFHRFWRALPPNRFAGFSTLDQLLAYLKRSAQSTSVDARRSEQRRQARAAAVRRLQESKAAESQISLARRVLDEIASAELYEYVTSSLNTSQERLVFRASVEWDLKPRVIAERWPDLFRDPAEVSTVKERIFRRLQRDGKLRILLGISDEDGGKN